VIHSTVKEFWICYAKLPQEIQDLADKNFELLKTDPRHKSLQFKKIGEHYSVRVGLHYRAVAILDGEEFVWFWIGSHAEYDDL
jgi:hypothetical protein